MIKEKDLQFKRTNRMRQSTTRIVIHHSASHDVDAKEIHQWHLDRGWLGIGYHFVIRENGDIERGRDEGTVGAHAGGSGNFDSIGVCLTGNFEKNEPTEEQIESLVWLTNYLNKYGELDIQGHSDVMNTACPGKYFPWDLFRDKLHDSIFEVTKEGDEMYKHFADVPDDAWYADDVNEMHERGLLNGYEDGTFRPEEPVTRAEQAVIMRRIIEQIEQVIK